MAKTLITQITDCIEHIIDMGGAELSKKIIIYPCGDVGIQVSNIMRNIYSIEPAYLIDNHKCKYTNNIHEISYLKQINTEDYVLFIASTNAEIYKDLKNSVEEYFIPDNIIELECMMGAPYIGCPKWKTEVGRHSYGPICTNHPMIKSIGSFCSFAGGVDCVGNHEMRYVTTHPFLHEGMFLEGYECPCEVDKSIGILGIEPKKERVKKHRRVIIGNDVWLGRNVIVTDGVNIGNGVIAAAGAVITKDVPDYAVVAGVPARIIKYRYTPEQIKSLNKIAWWDWTDDEIRERFDDFFLPIEDFIEKYKEKQ